MTDPAVAACFSAASSDVFSSTSPAQTGEWNKAVTDHELIANIHRRMDRQDQMLLEIRDKINAHVVKFDNVQPAMDELISLWKGSKILIPILAGLATATWAIIIWAKEHLK